MVSLFQVLLSHFHLDASFARERGELEQLKEMEVSLKHTLTVSQFGLEPDPWTISAWLSSGEFTVC